jgi:hypothetical protein
MPSDNSVIKVSKINNGLKEYYRKSVYRNDISFGITDDQDNHILFLKDNIIDIIRLVIE